MRMAQKKNSLDKETLRKIGIGFIYGLSTAIVAGTTAYTNGASSKVIIGVLITSFTGSFGNIIREYLKGDPNEPQTLNE